MHRATDLGFLKWREGFSVGDECIDRQHRRFFELAHQVERLIGEGAPPAEVARAVQAIRDDAVHHFEAEEMVLAELDFHAFDHHRAVHRGLVERLDGMAESLGAIEDPAHLAALAHDMVMALVEHLLLEDMRYKSLLLRSRGY